jgi:hypothetical protein
MIIFLILATWLVLVRAQPTQATPMTTDQPSSVLTSSIPESSTTTLTDTSAMGVVFDTCKVEVEPLSVLPPSNVFDDMRARGSGVHVVYNESLLCGTFELWLIGFDMGSKGMSTCVTLQSPVRALIDSVALDIVAVLDMQLPELPLGVAAAAGVFAIQGLLVRIPPLPVQWMRFARQRAPFYFAVHGPGGRPVQSRNFTLTCCPGDRDCTCAAGGVCRSADSACVAGECRALLVPGECHTAAAAGDTCEVPLAKDFSDVSLAASTLVCIDGRCTSHGRADRLVAAELECHPQRDATRMQVTHSLQNSTEEGSLGLLRFIVASALPSWNATASRFESHPYRDWRDFCFPLFEHRKCVRRVMGALWTVDDEDPLCRNDTVRAMLLAVKCEMCEDTIRFNASRRPSSAENVEKLFRDFKELFREYPFAAPFCLLAGVCWLCSHAVGSAWGEAIGQIGVLIVFIWDFRWYNTALFGLFGLVGIVETANRKIAEVENNKQKAKENAAKKRHPTLQEARQLLLTRGELVLLSKTKSFADVIGGLVLHTAPDADGVAQTNLLEIFNVPQSRPYKVIYTAADGERTTLPDCVAGIELLMDPETGTSRFPLLNVRQHTIVRTDYVAWLSKNNPQSRYPATEKKIKSVIARLDALRKEFTVGRVKARAEWKTTFAEPQKFINAFLHKKPAFYSPHGDPENGDDEANRVRTCDNCRVASVYYFAGPDDLDLCVPCFKSLCDTANLSEL